MKRIILLLFLVFTSRTAFAQLEVMENSLKHVKGFVYTLLDRDKQYDENDKPTSLIKLKTININNEQRKKLKFAGDLQTAFMYDFKDGEVWIYLTSNPTYIKITHPDYGVCEYDFPIDLQPHQCYELTLNNKFGFNMNEGPNVNYLIIESDREEAMIYIDDQFIGTKEGSKVFGIGEEHSWRIECKFYHTESGKATITSGSPITIDRKLRPAYGYLDITSEPESGAKIFIDGEMVGETPFKTDRIASGKHTVRVIKDMYGPAEQVFTVTDGETVKAVMKMSGNIVNVTLTTDSESDIYVDDEYKGKGSWNGLLTAGTHIVEARKTSHRSVKQTINLVLGKDENITISSPIPTYGDLNINSIPMKATIFIDGFNYGVTPKIVSAIMTGEHELRLEKEGYKPLTRKITIDEKNMLSLKEKLEKETETSTKTPEKKQIVSKKEKKVRTSKHLNWVIRAGAGVLSGVKSKIKLPMEVGYNVSGGFISSVKNRQVYWGMAMGLNSELKIEKYNYEGNLEYDSKIVSVLELSPFMGWKTGNGKVKFDPHLGAFLGYGFGTGFTAGCDAGLGLWFGRFNIDVTCHQSFMQCDYKYYYNHYYDEALEYHWKDDRDSSYLPCSIQIRLGVLLGKNK